MNKQSALGFVSGVDLVLLVRLAVGSREPAAAAQAQYDRCPPGMVLGCPVDGEPFPHNQERPSQEPLDDRQRHDEAEAAAAIEQDRELARQLAEADAAKERRAKDGAEAVEYWNGEWLTSKEVEARRAAEERAARPPAMIAKPVRVRA